MLKLEKVGCWMTLLHRLGNFAQRLFSGEVLSVDTKNYTAAILINEGRVLPDVPWLSPMGHVEGNGAHGMPVAGDRVLVSEYEYGVFVVIGSLPVPDGRSTTHKNARKTLTQGDYYIAVSDQTYILWQTPDFITIAGSHVCQIKLDGTGNIIYARAQRYQAHADGGYFYWDSDPATDKTVANWVFRDEASKTANIVHVRAGFHKTEDTEAISADIDKSVFSIIVKKVEQIGNDTYNEIPQFKFIVGADGRILVSGNSITETYRDYIKRYAETTMTDTAKSTISTESLEDGIYETAHIEIINTAPYINHTD